MALAERRPTQTKFTSILTFLLAAPNKRTLFSIQSLIYISMSHFRYWFVQM